MSALALTLSLPAVGACVSANTTPPLPTHYVSSAASNGYAVGLNSGSGNTKAAPWLTLDYAITNAPTGSIIALNDGTYTAATYFAITDKGLEIRAQNRRQVTLKAAAAQQRVVNLTSTLDRTWTLRGLVLDGQNDAQGNVTIGSSSLTSMLDVSIIDCELKDAAARAVLSNSQKKLNLSIRGCDASGTHSGTASVQLTAHEAGDIRISGLAMNCTLTGAATKYGVQYRSVTGVGTFVAEGVTGTLTTATATGAIYGVKGFNLNGMAVRSCNLTINATSTTGALYWLLCDLAGTSANNGFIENNQGAGNYNGGYLCLYGQDSTSAGDGLQNNGTIRNNTMTANTGAATVIHGCMLGFGSGGVVYGNTLTGAGLATIAKQQTGSPTFYGNTINRAYSQAFRSKGSVGATWYGNTVNVEAGYAGDVVTVDANDSPATNSTGASIHDNVFNIAAAPSKVVNVAASSDATFSGNTYTITATLAAAAWSYQGTTYDTLAAWKAVEPTALP